MTNAGIQILSYFKAQGRLVPTGDYPALSPPPLQKTIEALAGSLKTAVPIGDWTYDERPLAASASEELNLFNGTMLNQFNVGVVYATLKFVVVSFLTGNVGIRVGNAAADAHLLWFQGTTPAQDVVLGGPSLQQGGSVGKTVDNTHKKIKILNLDGAAGCTYSIFTAGV